MSTTFQTGPSAAQVNEPVYDPDRYNKENDSSLKSWARGLLLPLSTTKVYARYNHDVVPSSSGTRPKTTGWDIPPGIEDNDRCFVNCLVECPSMPTSMMAALDQLLQSEAIEDCSLLGEKALYMGPRYGMLYQEFKQKELVDERSTNDQFSPLGQFICKLMDCLGTSNLDEGAISTQHGCNVTADRAFYEKIGEGQPNTSDRKLLVVNELKSWAVLDEFGPKIIDKSRQPGGYALKAKNAGEDKVKNEDSIVAKLAYFAFAHEECPWGLVYGGNKYIILFLHHAPEGITTFCSPMLTIDDTVTPLIPLILYMLLSSEMPREDVMGKLGLTVPASNISEGTPNVNTQGMHTQTRVTRSKSAATASALSQATTVNTVSTSGGPIHSFQRIPLGAAIPSSSFICTLFLQPKPIVGSVGHVHRSFLSDGKSVVFKYTSQEFKDILRLEASVYSVLEPYALSLPIPVFYGLFTHDAWEAIILSDEGYSVDTFSTLSLWSRKKLFKAIKQMHLLGVVHGDFHPRNVVQIPEIWWRRLLFGEQLTIIDFTHASLGHQCPGGLCEELLFVHDCLALSTAHYPDLPFSILTCAHIAHRGGNMIKSSYTYFVTFIILGVLSALYLRNHYSIELFTYPYQWPSPSM